MTQRVAAERAGVTSGYWNNVEHATPNGRTGRPAQPSVPVVRALAYALDADSVELLKLAGYPAAAEFDRVYNAERADRVRRLTAAARDLLRETHDEARSDS
jgi:transcriptional regulator with XRE-family HTH domain